MTNRSDNSSGNDEERVVIIRTKIKVGSENDHVWWRNLLINPSL